MASLTVGSSSWESFLHDVWSIGDEHESSDDGDDDEAVEEAADEDASRAGAPTAALSPLALYFRNVVDDVARSPMLGPAPSVDFTFYPSFDEFFVLDDARAGADADADLDRPSQPTQAGTPQPHQRQRDDDRESDLGASADAEAGHRRLASADVAGHYRGVVVDDDGQSTPEFEAATAFHLAPSAGVDVRIFAAQGPQGGATFGTPQRGAGIAPNDPAGLTTPFRRKPRLEDLLLQAIAAGDHENTLAVARILDPDGEAPGGLAFFQHSEVHLRQRLGDLPQSRLLELHSLVLGAPAAAATADSGIPRTPTGSAPGSPSAAAGAFSPATAGRRRAANPVAGKPRRKSTGWSKRRRPTPVAETATRPVSGPLFPHGTIATTTVTPDDDLDDGDDEEIDVVGM